MCLAVESTKNRTPFRSDHGKDYGDDNVDKKDTWCEEGPHQVLLAGQGFDPDLLQAPAIIGMTTI